MSYRVEIGLAVFILAALSIAVVTGHPRQRDPASLSDPASTLRPDPGGSKGLYETLAGLGVPVERRRTALFTLADDSLHRPAMLVELSPPIPLLPAELDQVVDYVRGGGHVLGAARAGGIARCAGWNVRGTQDRFRPESLPVMPPAPGMRLPRVRRVLERWTDSSAERARQHEVDVKRGVTKVADASCVTLIAARTDTLLALRDRRPVIVRMRYRSGGSITLVAETDYLRNRAWRVTDAPLLLVPFFTAAPGRVSWDEFHQGYGRDVSPTAVLVGWLVRSPAGWALLQISAVALVWLAVTAVRFGPALAVVERRRRSPLEHLEALAAGLESAAGADTAVELTLAGLRRRLHRAGESTAGSATPADTRRWLQRLELSVTSARGRAAVRRLQHLTTFPGGGERVLAAAQAVEDVWEELRPRRTRD